MGRPLHSSVVALGASTPLESIDKQFKLNLMHTILGVTPQINVKKLFPGVFS